LEHPKYRFSRISPLSLTSSGDIMMVALTPLFSLQSIHFVANSYGCAFMIVNSHYCHFYGCTHNYCIRYHCMHYLLVTTKMEVFKSTEEKQVMVHEGFSFVFERDGSDKKISSIKKRQCLEQKIL